VSQFVIGDKIGLLDKGPEEIGSEEKSASSEQARAQAYLIESIKDEATGAFELDAELPEGAVRGEGGDVATIKT
jgi:hypothetical protein